MTELNSNSSIEKYRSALTLAFWSLFFILPVFFTRTYISVQINSTVIVWSQLFISIFFYKDTGYGLTLLFKKYPLIISVLFTTYALSYFDPRSQVYLVGLVFIATLIGLFCRQQEMNHVDMILKAKAITVFSITALFAIYYAFLSETALVQIYFDTQRLPFYRNFRHFNYELAIVIPLASYFLLKSKAWAISFWAISLAGFCYFSLVSGARGEAISLLAMIIALIVFKPLVIKERNFKVMVISIFSGFFLVFATGQQQYLLKGKLTQTFNLSSSIDRISSGRVEIWNDVLIFFNQQPFLTKLIGTSLDPSSVLAQVGHKPFVQPHNSFIQALIEFGYIGLAIYSYLSYLLLRAIFRILRQSPQLNLVSTSAISLIGIWVFSLVDGLFYHGIPLTFSFVLIAVVVWQTIKQDSNDVPQHLTR